jgi:hypothetical protein
MSDIVIYTTEDGLNRIELRVAQGTVWLTQMEIADLFATTKQNVSLHITNILEDGELDQQASVKESLTVQTEGARQVERNRLVYNLDMILAVGYRVRSPRGVQFRRWASTVLSEYLVKGFVMDDKRLKQPDFDYFDELLERIRDIRASEARFYKKVREILSLSEDYDSQAKSVAVFYATIQNKMLYAVTGFTAAELIVERADPTAPNMGLTSWKGTRVRKGDVKTAKNYLADPEISELNLIVTMFLDTADLRARRRQSMRLSDWDMVLDTFLTSNELPKLANAGSVSHERAVGVATEHYDSFDSARKLADQTSDLDISELEELEKIAKSTKKEDKT